MKSKAQRAIEVTQRVIGTPEEVFPYFTVAEKYLMWKGLEAELDARPGGIYRVHMGRGASVEGKYLVVDLPRRVVFSWGWSRAEGLPAGMAEVPPGSTTVEIDLIPDGDGTIIRLRHSDLPGDEAEVFHQWGWATFLERLEKVCVGGDPGPHPEALPAPSEIPKTRT